MTRLSRAIRFPQRNERRIIRNGFVRVANVRCREKKEKQRFDTSIHSVWI